MSTNIMSTRNASLSDLVGILKSQEARKHDIIVSASKIRARNGMIEVKGAEPELTPDGVNLVDGFYQPTRNFDSQLGKALGIPPTYLATTRAKAVDLYDVNINSWLHGRQVRRGGELEVVREADARNFLLRTFKGDHGTPGVVRALLSDRYSIIDNFETLLITMKAVKEAGVEAVVTSANLTETNMSVDLHVPAIAAMAPTLLGDYRNPFADPELDQQRQFNNLERWRQVAHREGMGHERGKEPVVYAGVRLSNCETGGGAWSITPKLRIEICKNGLTLPLLQERKVHLGAQAGEGVVQWSQETRAKELAVIQSKTKDAINTFLSQSFLDEQLGKIEQKAGKQLTKPAEVVRNVTKQLNFSKEETASILDHFIAGGQTTAAGLVNALTSYSQTVADADRADEIDDLAVKVLDLV